MAAVEFPVEPFDTAVGDGADFWEFARFCFPRGFPSASRAKKVRAVLWR
jgi:hypothetical protein